MARILIITSGIDSILNAYFELARRLQADGHSVHYASPDSARERVEAQGIAYSQLRALSFASAVPRDTLRRPGSWLAAYRQRRQRREAAAAQMLDPAYPELLQQLQPDLILIDIELHALIFHSLGLGYKVALLSNFLSFSPRVPPLHLPIIPGQGWRGTAIGIRLAWLRYWLLKARLRGRQWLRSAGLDDVSLLRHIAEAQGLNFGKLADHRQWLMPFACRGLPVIHTHAPEFDFPHQLPAEAHYIGPMIAAQRQDPAADEEQALLDWLSTRDTQRPLIYCAYGAHYNRPDTAFWQRLNAVAQAKPGWDFVFGLGKRLSLADLGPLAPNVHAYAWVPQLKVLRHANCAIVHAGISTLKECVSYAVPMLVYPFPVTDQRGNAARIVYHGLGLLGQREQDGPAEIGAALQTLLSEAHFNEALKAMQAHFQRYEDGAVLRQMMHDLLR